MAKNPRPTREEYRFIYDQLLKSGGDVKSVLAEYALLYEAGRLIFPYRADERLIEDAKKQLEAAREVLEEHIRTRVNPVMINAQTQHFSQMTKIAKYLLTYNEKHDDAPETEEWLMTDNEWIPTNDLVGYFKDNLESVKDEFGIFAFQDCFWPHIEAEHPELSVDQFRALLSDNPLKIVDTLKVLALRGTFKGSCPVCKDW
jgi:hypothetical protein